MSLIWPIATSVDVVMRTLPIAPNLGVHGAVGVDAARGHPPLGLEQVRPAAQSYVWSPARRYDPGRTAG
jgi:hypothetical protein